MDSTTKVFAAGILLAAGAAVAGGTAGLGLLDARQASARAAARHARAARPTRHVVAREPYRAASSDVAGESDDAVVLTSAAAGPARCDDPRAPGPAPAAADLAARPVAPATSPVPSPAVRTVPGTAPAEELSLDLPPGVPLAGSAEAGIDENTRFVPPARPDTPGPVSPPTATPQNVDDGRPFLQWQRATGDWGGARPALEDRGVSLNAQLTADGSLALAGGAHPRAGAYRQLLNANVTVDAEKLAGLTGGQLFVGFQHQVGRDGSAVVGDAQGFSNIDADGRTQLSELWYRQSAFGGKVRVKVGKADANVDFAAAAAAGEFLNSSMGFDPTIPLPTYPDPATGVSAFVEPTEAFYVGAGVYDGSYVRGVRTGENGPRTLFGSPAAAFAIGEAGVRWSAGPADLAGRFAIGGWHFAGDLPAFDGSTRSGTSGFYLVSEQQLWRKHPDVKESAAGVALFAQFGRADAGVSEISGHLGGGVAWTGAIDGRDDDVLGLGVTYVSFGNDPAVTRDGETAFELFYKWQLTPFLSVKPDLQYVRTPGGVRGRDDALVGTLRVSLSF